MKKALIFLLCLATAICPLTACNGNDGDSAETEVKVTSIGDEPIAIDDTDEYIVNGGKTNYKIVIGENADKVEKYSAEELQNFVEQSTAVKIPMTTDKNVTHDNNGRYISVGNTKLLQAQTDIKVDYSELGENGVIVKTKGNCVYIVGATVNGTLFAVYRFLHYEIGFEAYAYDCVEIDYCKSLKLKNFDYKHVPSLGMTTAEDAELSGPDKVNEASRMYIYASKNGGYNFSGNLFNGLWCHTTEFLISSEYDAKNVKSAETAEKNAKLDECKPEDKANGDFMAGFERGIEVLFSSMSNSKDEIGTDVAIKVYGYTLDDKNNLVETTGTNKSGYANFVRGYDSAFDNGSYHTGAEWQNRIKRIKIWNNNQACYSENKDKEFTEYTALDLATETLFNKFVKSATGPYLMVGINDGTGACDCEDCKKDEEIYGNPAGVQMVFMNKLAKALEDRMQEEGIEKRITLVAFAYYSYREPPVKIENGKYVPFHKDVLPKSDGMVKVGVMYTPIEACFTHPITDDGETCEKNATIAEEMKAWASLTDNLMMYSYGTNFQAYKYHFNTWSHTGDSFRFYERLGLKYYFEQACTQNGISPMSSMRVYVRSKLAWNANYNTQDLIDDFIEHYYGDGAEGVKQYFDSVMENFERIYTLAETEDQDIYYSRITSANFWTRPLMFQLESYLEKADYSVDMGSSDKKDVYKERIFREYFLLKDNEYTMYSAYLNSEELAEIEELVFYGREKYNAYNSTEKTNG